MGTNEKRLNIAVIGAGIAGIAAAHLLCRRHDVTLIERNRYIGGHTNTRVIEDDHAGSLAIDTGFIVCNPRTYPNFYRLLDEWGVTLRDSEMSFGFWCEESGIGYVGPSLREFMRKPSNLFNPRLIRMIRQQKRFNRRAMQDLKRDALDGVTLGQYAARLKLDQFFVDSYLVPIAAAIWSSPSPNMLDFPAETFVRFFENHGLLQFRHRPTWQTVMGGSHAYTRAFAEQFPGKIMKDSPVETVRRTSIGAIVNLSAGPELQFDHVVLATHADESLELLRDATNEERVALTAWRYHRNTVQLHTDTSIMPSDQRLWASWNYHRHRGLGSDAPLTMTYSMNRLQGLPTRTEYLVSLNATDRIDPSRSLYTVDYTHPEYTMRSVHAQQVLRDLCGKNHTSFCGSYLRYGFHEDAVVSAMHVAEQLRCPL